MTTQTATETKKKGPIRCAVYTRKSTSEGLDQEFNSLDAQRQAAENYISSQVEEYWICLPTRYDDGGFSGGNMKRPALQRLLQDIELGGIDLVLTYKVDRLTRCFNDFFKIMDHFEKYDVKYSTITQQFNTTTSMGRLTLNMLLSFAQFEREMVAERTRDKIVATRMLGKWTGGPPMLGYDIDPDGGKIVVNEEEAERVRGIFDLYLKLQRIIPTVQELNDRGWTTKRWTSRKGNVRGGKPFDRHKLVNLLTKVLYIGKIGYKDEVYDGEHDAIVDEETWKKVQALLKTNARGPSRYRSNKSGALLKGILRCGSCGTTMAPAYTKKRNVRYRYYLCATAQKQGWSSCPTKSIPALDIEQYVVDQIRSIGKSPKLVLQTAKRVRKIHDARLAELSSEYRGVENEMREVSGQIRDAMREATGEEPNSPVFTRLAELHTQLQTLEKRATQINEEGIFLNKHRVEDEEVALALGQFKPVWDAMSPKDRERLLHLLVERVAYNGETERLTITFRPSGIKELGRKKKEVGNATV